MDYQSSKRTTRFNFALDSPTAHHAPDRKPDVEQSEERNYGPRIRRALVLPAPETYFGSWAMRWLLCCPHAIPQDVLTLVRERMVVSDCQGGTVKVWLKDRPIVGFVGTVCFEIVKPSNVPTYLLQYLEALARFAEFCGTGVDTMCGMGRTRYLK